METLTTGKITGMKRNYLYILLSLAILSCSKAEEKTSEIQAEYSPKFYADLGSAYTKTFVDDCLQIYWNKNDKISVFTSTANQLYKFDGDTGDSEGEFSVVEIDKSSTGEPLAIDANFAVYPFQEETTISSDGTLTMSVPEIQYYSKKGFGLDSNPMVAVTENKNDTFLSFKNVCGYLRLFLYGENITAKRIRLEGNLKEPLSGKADVVMSYGQEPDISLHGDSHTITLDCSDGVKLGQSSDTATEFWFVLPPMNFTNGFTIIIEDDCGNKYTKSTENKIEIKRNTVSNMITTHIEDKLEYQLFEKEADGIDGIITHNGVYALLKETPNNDAIVLITGKFDDEEKEYMFIDGNGFIQAMSLENNVYVTLFYTPDCIWILDDNRIIAEIPYDEFQKYETEPQTKASFLTRNPIYQALSIQHRIKELLKKPIKTTTLMLLECILKGNYGRYGETASNLIDLAFDCGDIYSIIGLLDRLYEIQFFDNAQLTTLPAEIEDVINVTLPCEISSLSEKTLYFYAKQRYGKLVNYSYTLNMDVYESDSFYSSIIKSQSKNISGNGVEEFDFTADELNHIYGYEPSLKVDITIEIDLSAAQKAAISDLPPGYQIIEDQTRIDRKTCTIYGEKQSFVIGSVTSYVEKVDNVKSTSADITYSFSNVPSGAECEILVTRKGTDMSIIYPGKPRSDNEKIGISGLTPSTDYTATSRITYKGIAYTGTKSVSFCTPGPSGQILSIQNEDITTSSAILKCKFSNVENGVTCGIIVKGEDGSNKSISASNIESEQNVTVSGLKPATTYSCTPYVRLGTYYKEGNSLSFTTKLPDVTGTWNCREKHYKTNGEEYYQTYSVTLHDDGTVTTTLYDSFIGATWGRSKTALSVNIHLTAPQYAGPYWIGSDSGHDLSILFDDPTNPTSGKGRAKTWAVSATTGTGSSNYFDLEMTK